MNAILLPASDHQQVSWKNGGGHTIELAIRPDGGASARGGDPFDWRLSIATVDRDGGFSVFPGVDRSLMALSPQGLDLIDSGTLVGLRQHEVHRFAGENEVFAVGVTAPTLDLNLMTRREAFSGGLQWWEMTGEQVIEVESGAVVVVMLSGELTFQGCLLKPHDAVLMENGGTSFVGHAEVAIASIVTRG